MFSKCIYCDKLHLCTNREKYHKSTIGSRWRQQISEAILPLITEDTRLRNLYQKWSVLTPTEKVLIDEQEAFRDCIDLYMPLKEAMIQWETVQDTQGAPGFEQGLYTFTCDSQLEEELYGVVHKMDEIVKSITKGNLKVSNQREQDFSYNK
ncbi:hypothetical protein O3M35_002267 [Rhynocoris fuscipes]|uniref:Uncharacterized protein n=1 Tax=Rhynocoris fuscipes TaxID=488301 RepID=A0AAW1CYM7_9HEMI